MPLTRRQPIRRQHQGIFKKVKYDHQQAVSQEILDASLLTAVRSGSSKMRSRTLISSGAHVNCTDSSGYSPLLLAVSRDCNGSSAELVSTLCKLGADVNFTSEVFYGDTPLHLACTLPDSKCARALLASGADVHARNFAGHSPLHVAALHGNAETVRLLILHGADVNATELYCGYTPLHLAANGCHDEAILLLAECGANVLWSDLQGFTPIGRCQSQDIKHMLTELSTCPKRLEELCCNVIRNAVRTNSGLDGFECLPVPRLVSSRIKLESS